MKDKGLLYITLKQACLDKATESWEEDEKMSDKATKAAVLFANTEHAYLKEKYPLWSDRVKRINNLWRKLSSADRDVFVKKARENRADVPKRRNRRTTSSANKDQLSGSVEDLADVSQDSSRSHLDTVNDAQSNGQHNPPIDPRVNFSQVMGQPSAYPGNPPVQMGQPYKVMNPRLSGDAGHLNGMPLLPNVAPMTPGIPPMQINRPDLTKDLKSISRERVPVQQAPLMSKVEWERYSSLREQHNQINQHRANIDEELIKLRKVKKNVKAKVRSLTRSRESLLMNNMNANYSTSEIDENNAKVEATSNQITDKQKLLERFKHDLKEIASQLQSFESRYHVNQAPTPTGNLMTPNVMDPHAQISPFAPHQPMPFPQQQPPNPALSSPTYPFVAPSNINPAFVPPFRQNSFYEPAESFGSTPNSFYPSSSNIRLASVNSNFQPSSPILSNPPTPPSARPTSSASTEIAPKSGRGRKRRRPLGADEIRTSKLGNIFYNQLTDPFDREIYSVLDLMVGWVEAAVDSGNENLFQKLPTMRTSSLPIDQDNSAAYKVKQRRSRTVVKKPPGQEANEYEAFVEKLQNQLKLCPMPILTYEQSSFIDTSIPQFCDITKLNEEIGREFIGGNEIENYHLTFMPDYYLHVEQQTPFDRLSLFPETMSKIYADVDVDDLETSEDPLDLNLISGMLEVKKEALNEEETSANTNESTNDEINKSSEASEVESKVEINERAPSNVDNYELFWRDITSDEVGNFYTIPILQKPNDDNSELPIPPHRSVFKSQKKRHLDHRYAITLTIENVNLDEKVLKELQNLINNPDDLEIIEQTPPPESPQQAQEIKEEPMNEEMTENMVEQMCRQCDGLVKHSRVAEFMTKLGIEPTEDEELNTFCSMPCYLTYMAETTTPIAPEVYKHALRFVDESIVEQLTQSESTLKKAESLSLPTEHELKLNLGAASIASTSQARTSTANLLSPIEAHFDANYYSFNYSSNAYSNEQILRVCDLPPIGQNNRAIVTTGEYKWKGFGWQIYDDQIVTSFHKTQEDIHQKLVAIQTQCSERTRFYRNGDTRFCAFCREAGDGEQDITGRLLNVDANEWVHVNCALWSTEVFENENGVLKNVDVALKSAQLVQCKVCQRFGASLRCYKHNCENSKSFYHLPCAKKANGKFGIDKLFYCPLHDIRQEVCLERLGTLRRICIEREETPLLAKIFNHSYPIDMVMRVGSMIFRSIGQVLPEQVKNFHSEEHIFPVGYHVTRLFWSPFNVREQTRFECSISDDDGQPMFHVQMTEGQVRMFSDRTMAGAWSEIFQSVKKIRNKEMLQFYPDLINASMLFGLQEPAITKIAESLPGVDQMFNYTVSHENSPLLDLPLAVNPTGCARCEPRSKTLSKHRSRPLITQSPRKKMITTNGSAQNEFTPEIISREARRTRSQRCIFTSAVGDENLIQLMRRSGITESMLMSSHVRYDTASLHNAHSQYKKMKQEWQNYVYLGRSGIAGLGLYAKRDLDMNTIIIEYVGEIIRSELGEVREKRYLSQNRGIYMFRIDEEYIIDATMTGGLARYINHSCDPNCSTRVLQYNDEKKIVIIANRPIKAGEELAYDYQFELEDDAEKIPCLCGAPNCVKWMN